MDSLALIALSGLGLILLYTVLILQKVPKQRKDYLLAVIFVMIGFELFFRYANKSISNLYYSWLVGFDLFYWVLFGPLMYLYIEFVIYKYRRFKYSDLIHFIPLLFLLFPYISFLKDSTDNIHFFTFIDNSNLFYQVLIIIWDYITPTYFIFIVIKLINHKKSVSNYFSNLQKNDLTWLLYLAGGYMTYLITYISLSFVNELLNIEIPFVDVETSIIPLIIYVLGLGIYGYKQEGIFGADILKSIHFNHEKERRGGEFKYSKSGLSDTEGNEIVQNLKTLIETEKPYLNSDLTINDLSKLVNTTIHKLSQVINASFQKNFYEFINEYRIKEVERMLKDPANRNFKIISLAYDCGFNSKSAFYSAFKHYTGITPTEYRNNLNREDENISSI